MQQSTLLLKRLMIRFMVARPLKRYIQKYVETLSAKLILEDKVDQGDIIYIDVDGDHLTAGVRKP